jgi:hypothetical protein
LRLLNRGLFMFIVLLVLLAARAAGAEETEDATRYRLLNDVYDQGFTWTSADDHFSLKINGALQVRYTFLHYDDAIAGNGENLSSFYIRRARLYLRGHAYDRRLRYFIHLQLEPTRTVNAHDLWLEYEFSDLLRLGVGRLKIAFGLEFLASGLGLEFVERSLFSGETEIDSNPEGPEYPGGGTARFGLSWIADTGFATGGLDLYRSQGVQLSGRRGSTDSPTVEYQLGLWNGRSTLGLGNTGDGHLVALRAGYYPWGWIDWAWQGDGEDSRTLRVGVVGSAYTASGAAGGTIDEKGWDLGFLSRFRGFSLDGEWATERFDLAGVATQLERRGWRVEGGWFVVAPTLQVVGRYATIQRLVDPTYATAVASGLGVAMVRAPSGDEVIGIEKGIAEVTVGFSWYIRTWHRNKLQLDVSRLVRTFADDPGAVVDGRPTAIAAPPDQVDHRVRAQVQIAF